MLFKKKNVENEEWYKYSEEKEKMLLNMVQDSGLALSLEEKKGLESSGWIDTGKFNGHGQPLVKNVKTGEVLSVCRSYSAVMSTTCGVKIPEFGEYYNPCGRAY